MTTIAKQAVTAARELSAAVDRLEFHPPVACVYNPLAYAWAPHELYLTRHAASRKRVMFLGMNPGPFGMVQTGVPFGEIAAARKIALEDGAAAFFTHVLETGAPSGWRRLAGRLGHCCREPIEEFLRQAHDFETSQPRSLLSMARSNSARSRKRQRSLR